MIGTFKDFFTLLSPGGALLGRKEETSSPSVLGRVLAPDPFFWILLAGAGTGAYFLLRKKRRGRR